MRVPTVCSVTHTSREAKQEQQTGRKRGTPLPCFEQCRVGGAAIFQGGGGENPFGKSRMGEERMQGERPGAGRLDFENPENCSIPRWSRMSVVVWAILHTEEPKDSSSKATWGT